MFKRCSLVIVFLLASSQLFAAQGESAREAALIDLEGYWVSVASEDWRFRMVDAPKGVYSGLTLNAEGRRVGDSRDAEFDRANGRECLAYGAPSLMRMASRFQITWEDDDTLRIDSDYGSQTRLLHFGDAPPGAPSLQGYSKAQWIMAPDGGGNLKVITTNLSDGYLRKNGAPYSSETTLTEYINVHTMANGDRWINITTEVDDPIYFSAPLVHSTDLKQLPNRRGWNPTACVID
jgi:hypothetical protein